MNGVAVQSLVDYGIHTEESDIRAHVCVIAGKTYVYQTRHGVSVCQSGKFPKKAGYQPGVEYATAMGYLVPWDKIPGIVPIPCKWLIDEMGFNETDSTSLKGQKASRVVERLIRIGWFPLPVVAEVATDVSIQHKGIDLIVSGKWRIQVKCDYKGGGDKSNGSRTTGNLYLQVAECNPLKAT